MLWGRLFIVSTDLLNLPNIVGLQKLSEVVILLLAAHLVELCIDSIIIGGSIDIADDAKGDGETILRRHQGELQLQGIVLTVGIVNEDIINGVAVLANLDNLQALSSSRLELEALDTPPLVSARICLPSSSRHL